MGRAALAEAEAANELDSQGPSTPGDCTPLTSGRADPKASSTEITALHLFEQLGDLSGQAHMLNNLASRRSLRRPVA